MSAATAKDGREGPGRPTLEDIYEAHQHRVFAWALRYCAGDMGLAEDLVHDVFLRALQRLDTLDRPGELLGWLHRVTANLALNRLRSERTFSRRVARLLGAGRQPTPAPVDQLELREATLGALALLQRLPDQERVVLCMKLIDDKSQREIAQALDLSEGYVSKLVGRALARLRALGWEDDDEA